MCTGFPSREIAVHARKKQVDSGQDPEPEAAKLAKRGEPAKPAENADTWDLISERSLPREAHLKRLFYREQTELQAVDYQETNARVRTDPEKFESARGHNEHGINGRMNHESLESTPVKGVPSVVSVIQIRFTASWYPC